MNLNDEPIFKFDGCETCALRACKRACKECDAGELYEEDGVEAVDRIFADAR